jgi:uncharacterized protein (TIGR02246 family)
VSHSDDRRLVNEALAETRAAFVTALRDGDPEAAAAVYADDARLLAPSADLLQGRQAIERFWAAGVAAGVCDVELEPLELERNDSLAYEIGRYALKLRDGDAGMVVDRGKYVLVHARQEDASWRWAVEMFNPDTPPATAARPEEGRRQ